MSKNPDIEQRSDLPEGQRHVSVDPAANARGPVVRPPRRRRRLLSVDELVAGVKAGDRAILASTITLVESRNPSHQLHAREVLTRLMPRTGRGMRLGITGVPGVGKSTFIDAFGMARLSEGRQVAVLAVDPSSSVTGGSILGDKTRMARLGRAEGAFIRPSPAGGTLGGVASRTRETMLLCEAAGYDLVIVETVGVGQSETRVSEMTDVFLALLLPGAGDELQGVKRRLIELADLLAINKADGDRVSAAEVAAGEYRGALRCMQRRHPDWTTPVLTCSASTGAGLDGVWSAIRAYHDLLRGDGSLERRRQKQNLRWMWSQVDERLREMLHADPGVQSLVAEIEAAVGCGEVPAAIGADRVLAAFGLAAR